jgi:protein-S-isoprenylcysteine O-methyltransferase
MILKNRYVKAVIIGFVLTIMPTIGNMQILQAAQIWILFVLGVSGSILQPDYNLVEDKSKSLDGGTEVLIIWSVFITQILAILEATYLRYPESIQWDPLVVFVLALMVLGFALRVWAIFTLGRYFTMHLGIQENHKVIRNGPYRYFRHPSYAGAFLTYMGTSIFLHSWYSAAAAAIILPFAWLRRMHYEERMMLEEFGTEYRSYCRSVKRVIPCIW